MRPSTLRPSIMTPEGLALLHRETQANSPAAKAKARPTAMAPGAYGSMRCVGATVVARGSHGHATIMLLLNASTREELHNEIVKELTRRGLALHYVKDYGDA